MAEQFYTTEIVDRAFVIRERASAFADGTATARGWTAVSKRSAWDAARGQSWPVRFVALDGTTTELGEVFSPAVFERTVYRAYVSQGLSLTDGYFGPQDFEAWVGHFRKSVLSSRAPGGVFNADSDVPEPVSAALTRYSTALRQASGR